MWSAVIEVFELVELYLGDGLEIEGCLSVVLGSETAQFLLWYLELVELHSRDGLEMVGYLVMTLSDRLHGHCCGLLQHRSFS